MHTAERGCAVDRALETQRFEGTHSDYAARQGQTQRVNSTAPARPGRPPGPRREAPQPCLPVGTKL